MAAPSEEQRAHGYQLLGTPEVVCAGVSLRLNSANAFQIDDVAYASGQGMPLYSASLCKVPEASTRLKYASFFGGSGIGDAGMERAGLKLVMVVDKSDDSRTLYAHRFPDAEYVEDVQSEFDIPDDVDVLNMTFPCQDVTALGERLMMDGERTRLFQDALEKVRARADAGNPVKYIVLENVEGLLNLGRQDESEAVIGAVLDALDNLGYDTGYRLVDSIYIARGDGRAVPMARPRVAMLATHRSISVSPADLLHAENFVCNGTCSPACGVCFCSQYANAEAMWKSISMAELKQLGAAWDMSSYWGLPRLGVLPCFTRGNTRMAVFLNNSKFGMLRLSDAVELFGVPGDWFSCLTNPSRSRVWQFLGDAVYAPMFEWIGKRIINADGLKGAFDMEALAEALPGRAPGDAWPRSGMMRGGVLYRIHTGPAPSYVPYVPVGEYFRNVEPQPVNAEAIAFSLNKMDEAAEKRRLQGVRPNKLLGPFRLILERLAGLAGPSQALEEGRRRSGRFSAAPEELAVAVQPVIACGACAPCLASPRTRCILSAALGAAQKGHVGAQLTLQMANATGTRITMRDKLCEICSYEADSGSHRVKFFEADKTQRVALWTEDVTIASLI